MNNVKSRIRESMKSGFFKGVGLGAGFLTTGLFAAALSMNLFAPGDVVSSSKLNQNFAIAAPEGAIMAFYLASCPDGWAPADGTNGTPDLRGQFIRGRDDVGTGAAGNDPDGVRALGNLQLDAFQGHKHGFYYDGSGSVGSGSTRPNTYANATGSYAGSGAITDTAFGNVRVANETRPKNVALTYCMRKN